MAHQENHAEESKGFWYTYFGEGGSAVFAFIWILAAIAWIYYIVTRG